MKSADGDASWREGEGEETFNFLKKNWPKTRSAAVGGGGINELVKQEQECLLERTPVESSG